MPELEGWRQQGPWSFPVTQDMDSVPKDDTQGCFPHAPEQTGTHPLKINVEWNHRPAWAAWDLLESQTMEDPKP